MRLSNMEIHLLDDGFFKHDGGATFGVAPKALWKRTNPPDEENRVVLRAGVLLIRTGEKNILVDVGLGTKLGPKLLKIYDFKESMLLSALADVELTPDDIDVVVLTHLHSDHAGGATYFNEASQAVPRFPRAQHLVQEKEWQAAMAPNELTKAFYTKDDFFPLKEKGLLKLIDGDYQLTDRIKLKLTGAHSAGHQIVLLDSDGDKAVFPGDIIPTVTHLRLPFIAAYDLFPLEVLEEKKILIEKALQENWLLIWDHDPRVKMGHLYRQDNKILVKV